MLNLTPKFAFQSNYFPNGSVNMQASANNRFSCLHTFRRFLCIAFSLSLVLSLHTPNTVHTYTMVTQFRTSNISVRCFQIFFFKAWIAFRWPIALLVQNASSLILGSSWSFACKFNLFRTKIAKIVSCFSGYYTVFFLYSRDKNSSCRIVWSGVRHTA